MTCTCFSWLSIESKRGRERGRGRGHAPSILCIGMLLSIVESCARHLYWPLRLGQQYICCCIVSPSGDNKYCWQDVLWDVAAVVTFLRSALKFAAVVAAQIGAHLASISSSFGVHLEPIWRPEGPKLAQEACKRPKWSPRGAKEAPR